MSSENPKKSSNETQVMLDIKSRIDAKAESIELIDYSFKDLMSVDEIEDSLPRYADKREPKKVDGKYASLGLKLSYNALKDINGLYEWCTLSFAYPHKISSLDLSFNCLSNIPDEIIRFEGLKCLYLHANKILDLKEVDKLRSLKLLTALTLHGNPIENLPIFKHYILSRVPELKHLNFTGVSKVDKQTALIRLKANSTPLAVVPVKADQSKKTVLKEDD